MQITRLILGLFETNCYIVAAEGAAECLLIDPADHAERIQKEMHAMGLTPAAILLTHGHYDHMLAAPELKKMQSGLPLYCHPLDVAEERSEYDPDLRRSFPTVRACTERCALADGERLMLAGLDIEVIATPGHTPGSVVFRIEDALFTGDTLFWRDIGRTDFPGGSYPQMLASLRRLDALPYDADVYPGHGMATRLDEERKYNSYIKEARKGGA